MIHFNKHSPPPTARRRLPKRRRLASRSATLNLARANIGHGCAGAVNSAARNRPMHRYILLGRTKRRGAELLGRARVAHARAPAWSPIQTPRRRRFPDPKKAELSVVVDTVVTAAASSYTPATSTRRHAPSVSPAAGVAATLSSTPTSTDTEHVTSAAPASASAATEVARAVVRRHALRVPEDFNRHRRDGASRVERREIVQVHALVCRDRRVEPGVRARALPRPQFDVEEGRQVRLAMCATSPTSRTTAWSARAPPTIAPPRRP